MSKKLFSAEELELEEMLNEDPQANFDIPLDEGGDIRLQTDPSYRDEKLYYDTHQDASGPEEELAKLERSEISELYYEDIADHIDMPKDLLDEIEPLDAEYIAVRGTAGIGADGK